MQEERTQEEHIITPLFIEIALERCKTVGLKGIIEIVEGALIREALRQTDDNTTHAGILLGVERTSLIEKRRRLGFPIKSGGRPRLGE